MKFLMKLLKLFMKVEHPVSEINFKRNTLELRLDREWFTNTCTIGSLYVDGEFECYILEDYDRLSKGQKKVPGETAIPMGTYEVQITYSPKFKEHLPLLKDVPGFKGIRIHAGNTDKDTSGCLLPGQVKYEKSVGRSRLAFNALFKKLEAAKEEGKKIYIKVGM